MRLISRIYLTFRDEYQKQSDITLHHEMNNAADMYQRETISILGTAINKICDKEINDEDMNLTSISGQKSGLKVSIINALKMTSKLIIGYFLMRKEDDRAKDVVDFLKVLKLFENDIFGDAYYDINYKKNFTGRKTKNIGYHMDEDVDMLYKECFSIIDSIDEFDFVGNSKFVSVRSATVCALTMFNAQRGGEPARLYIYINGWKLLTVIG